MNPYRTPATAVRRNTTHSARKGWGGFVVFILAGGITLVALGLLGMLVPLVAFTFVF